MDSITQAVLGAAVGQALLGKRIGYKAAILGAIGGTIPDLDVLLMPFFSTLENISIHRGYSHSIFFSVLGGLLLAWGLSRLKWCSAFSYGRLFVFTFLVLFTHIMLDAFTTYGTQLFLPFSDTRVSFDSINIVDPVYTVPLIIGLAWTFYASWRKKEFRPRANQIGLLISSCYLLFTLINKQGVTFAFETALEAKGISTEKILTVPVKVASVHWYGVGRTSDLLYIGRYSPFIDNPITFDAFPVNDSLLNDLDPELVDRMKWFAQGYYVVAVQEGRTRFYNMQCDMQGVRTYGDYKAPTAFYYEIEPFDDGSYDLSVGMHPRED